MRNLLTLLCICAMVQLHGQNITIELDRDMILQDNHFSVTINLENVDGDFEQPTFEGLNQRGVSTSISTSIINGVKSSAKTYTYSLYADEIGSYMIPPISVETDEGVIETEPFEIIVLPNPDGIIQQGGKSEMGDTENLFFDRMKQNTEEENHEILVPSKTPSKRKLKKI